MKEMSEMGPHQVRVVEEKAQLDKKLVKLEAFIQTATYASLRETDRRLLVRQLRAMRDYSEVLLERIQAF